MTMLAASMLLAQEAKPKAEPKPPTVAELQKQIAEKDAKIFWLQSVVKATSDKLDSILKFYASQDALRGLDQSDPDKKAEAPKK